MSTKRSLDSLKAAIKRNNSGESRPSNYFRFWDMPDNSQAIVRFLPDANEDNPMQFLVEKLMHTLVVNGKEESVPCLKMYGEECPICKLSASYYKENDKVNGKKYWRKKQHLAQVLVKEDPLAPDDNTGENSEGKVRVIALGYQLFTILNDAFESGELDEVPYAYEDGTDFIIKKSKQGDYSGYTLSKFARKSTDLTDDERAYVQSELIDLSTLLPKNPGAEKVKAMLEAALTGEEYADGNTTSAENESFTQTVEQSINKTEKPATKKKAKPVEEEAPTSSDSEFDDEADEILAQILARNS